MKWQVVRLVDGEGVWVGCYRQSDLRETTRELFALVKVYVSMT